MFSIQQYAWLVGTQYKPMELAKSDWAGIKKSPPWAIDSWGMGMLFSVIMDNDGSLKYWVEWNQLTFWYCYSFSCLLMVPFHVSLLA